MGIQGTIMTRNLQVEDVKEIAQQAKGIDGDPMGVVTRIFQGLGDSATVTGDVLQQGLAESGIPVPREASEIFRNVQAVTKTGDQVQVQLGSQIQPVMRGTQLRLGPAITFTVQNFPDGMAMADIAGVSVNKFVWIDVQRVQYHNTPGKRSVLVETNFGGKEFALS
jgi:hypothetical protein